MDTYRRPDVPAAVFHDATGAVVPHGSRWGPDGPPEDSYSVVTHSERFRPLHTVADAVAAHLAARYDVDVEHEDAPARDEPGAVRVTTLRPRDPDAATVTLVRTDFPGVVVRAGHLLSAHLPPCGCDACDDTWEQVADELEHTVAAVVAGTFQEWCARRDGVTWAGHALGPHRGRSSSGETVAGTASDGRGATACAGPGDAPVVWAPWPLRHA